ncbi:MAG: flagellar basal body P-ring protein FlgI [Phycisphaerales bacterium]
MITLLTAFFIVGCNRRSRVGGRSTELTPATDLGVTIGSLVDVSWPESVRLEGYGLVVGLRGTGSSECPPQVRAYFSRHIPTLLPNRGMNVDKMINGSDTAVVSVEGLMPTIASMNQTFDVRVTALPGTQTTSLEGGYLLGTELKTAGTFGITSRIVANAQGAVFIDKLNTTLINRRTGYVLTGGKVLDEYKIVLMLHKPDFRVTNNIRNRLDELFGNGTAKVILPGRIEVKVPPKYRERKHRFVAIIKATYLVHSNEMAARRINAFANKLATSQDGDESEIALEAIGNHSLSALNGLLNISDEHRQLRVARCMLNLGSDAGLTVLRRIAMNRSSLYRVEALESITAGARRKDAILISQRLLRDGDFQIRLAAYEQLRKLDDIAVMQERVADNFYLEQVAQMKYKSIFVSRRGQPRIVLFGVPILCSESVFVRSADGNITINAPADQEYVSIIRKHPERPEVVAQLRSSYKLDDIIKTLCGTPATSSGQERGGLGVSYADVISLLKRMCDKGAVKAEFWAGPLPKIG